jgi:hypothetical protein
MPIVVPGIIKQSCQTEMLATKRLKKVCDIEGKVTYFEIN